MIPHIVQYPIYEPQVCYDIHKYDNVYEFRQKGRLPLLQRFLFFLLSKLNCGYTEQHRSIKTITVDYDSIMEMAEEAWVVYHNVYAEPPTYIVLGRKQLQALRIELQEVLTVEMPPEYIAEMNTSRPYAIGRIYSMSVVLHPHFDGICILPSLEKYK